MLRRAAAGKLRPAEILIDYMSKHQENTVPSDYPSSLARVAAVAKLKAGAHVHVSGICGTGMAAVATLLKVLGYKVTGSDKAFYPPIGDTVRALGVARLFESYSAENLEPRPDLVVIGNSLSRGNPEVEAVLERGIPFASMPELFSALLIGDHTHCANSVVVAGTHGKTTTSAAIATLLDSAGLRPGYFVGGVPQNLPGNVRQVDTTLPVERRFVVLEGDEYDSAFFAKWPKFHSYRPDILVATSLEFDHGDIYQNLAEIEAEFSRLVISVPRSGAILVCDQGEHMSRVINEWRNSDARMAELLVYGLGEGADFRLLERTQREGKQHLRFKLRDRELQCSTTLSGVHNALNLLSTAAVGVLADLSDSEIVRGIESFLGVWRRQQVLADISGVTVIEDFAHHPTAVDVTLWGLREKYAGRRVVAVFEPRSNTSRRGYFQAEYSRAFAAADLVVIKEVVDASGYSKTAEDLKPLDVKKLVEAIKETGKSAVSFGANDAILDYLMAALKSGDVVVLMSNGDFGGLMQQVVAGLKQRN